MYGARDIAQAARRQAMVKRERGEARPLGSDGRRSMQIDAVLFHNAIQGNREVYGVDNIWNEPEFCEDMKRRHPELAVETKSGKTSICLADGSCPAGIGRRTRFGRVTWHKRYG